MRPLRRPFLTIAHRGAPDQAPENTIAAFDKALALGFTHIELDAQLSADGVPVVFHDRTLERTTDGEGPLAAHTLAELKQLDAGRWFGEAFRGERIPTLEGVLTRYLGRAYLHLELKSEEPQLPAAVAQLLVRTGWPTTSQADTGENWPKNGVTISSFHKAQLDRMREVLPEVLRAWLVQELSSEVLAAARAGHIRVVCPRAGSVSREQAEAARALGLGVRAWGLRDTEELAGLVGCGVEGTTCDWPERAREHLRRLGVLSYP